MPTKKVSDRQRIITYASQCDKEQLLEAVETLQAILAGRFPKEPRKPATGRKRAPKQAAQPDLPPMPVETFNDDAPAMEKEKPVRRKVEKFTPDPHMVAAIEEGKRNRIEDADMLED